MVLPRINDELFDLLLFFMDLVPLSSVGVDPLFFVAIDHLAAMIAFGVEPVSVLRLGVLVLVVHLLFDCNLAPLIVLHICHELHKAFGVFDAFVCFVFIFLELDDPGLQVDLLLLGCLVIINCPHHISLIPCDKPGIQVHRSRFRQCLAVLEPFRAGKAIGVRGSSGK